MRRRTTDWGHEHLVRGRGAALNDYRDAALDEGLIGVIASRKLHAVNGSGDPSPVNLDDKLVGPLERLRERRFSENSRRAISTAHQKQLVWAV
jgi:hypothetical protein